MDSVFVAGSRAMSKLNAPVKERLDNILRKECTVLIGDANGAVWRMSVDAEVQRRELNERMPTCSWTWHQLC